MAPSKPSADEALVRARTAREAAEVERGASDQQSSEVDKTKARRRAARLEKEAEQAELQAAEAAVASEDDEAENALPVATVGVVGRAHFAHSGAPTPVLVVGRDGDCATEICSHVTGERGALDRHVLDFTGTPSVIN